MDEQCSASTVFIKFRSSGRVGKPADDSMRVKSSEALWFASLHLSSVEANAG